MRQFEGGGVGPGMDRWNRGCPMGEGTVRELEFEVAPIPIIGCALCFIQFGPSSPLWGNVFDPGEEFSRSSEDKWV